MEGRVLRCSWTEGRQAVGRRVGRRDAVREGGTGEPAVQSSLVTGCGSEVKRRGEDHQSACVPPKEEPTPLVYIFSSFPVLL